MKTMIFSTVLVLTPFACMATDPSVGQRLKEAVDNIDPATVKKIITYELTISEPERLPLYENLLETAFAVKKNHQIFIPLANLTGLLGWNAWKILYSKYNQQELDNVELIINFSVSGVVFAAFMILNLYYVSKINEIIEYLEQEIRVLSARTY